MEGMGVDKKRIAKDPITINLPDGKKVVSTHVCDINIPGLLTMLMGHIVPSLKVASLIGIRLLCKAGCNVVFDNEKCEVIFNNKVIWDTRTHQRIYGHFRSQRGECGPPRHLTQLQ
jgi:hypothetical protein